MCGLAIGVLPGAFEEASGGPKRPSAGGCRMLPHRRCPGNAGRLRPNILSSLENMPVRGRGRYGKELLNHAALSLRHAIPAASAGKIAMHHQVVKILVFAAAGLSLAACNTTTDVSSAMSSKPGNAEARATPAAAGRINRYHRDHLARSRNGPRPTLPRTSAAPAAQNAPSKDGKDDIAAGREHFRAGRFAEAEVSFDRAAKLNPREAEAWLGLAACYDRMRRFELADRAYVQAMAIRGPTAEILNNQGYSYLLRGDNQRARNTLTAAKNKDPGNSYVQNNLQLLEQAERKSAAR